MSVCIMYSVIRRVKQSLIRVEMSREELSDRDLLDTAEGGYAKRGIADTRFA